MTRFNSVLFVSAAIAAMSAFAPPAAAIEYPWCAIYDAKGGGKNCGFSTLEQCRATVSGIGGFCQQNQFYTGPSANKVRRARKRNND